VVTSQRWPAAAIAVPVPANVKISEAMAGASTRAG